MSEYDRKKHLKTVHQARKAITTEKVNNAIKSLLKTGEPINFNSISKEANVSKATLYNSPLLREQIETLRQQKIKKTHELKQTVTENSKDAMIESLKRKNQKLEKENKELKDQLKLIYSKIYNTIE